MHISFYVTKVTVHLFVFQELGSESKYKGYEKFS